MSGTVRDAWVYLGDDLWMPLANHHVSQDTPAPASLFGDLYVSAADYLSPSPMPASLEEAGSDPQRARELFLELQGTDFTSESAAVRYLESVYKLIEDYERIGYAQRYAWLVKSVAEKYNLRYRVEDPFRLRFLLPGSFANLYDELHRRHAADRHLVELLGEFEQAFDAYLRDDSTTNLKTCIGKASNYVEGVVSTESGSHGTLGKMCDQLSVWPHNTIKESLKCIYGFCSDYPGIRHGSSSGGVHRELEARDLTLASLLLLTFSGYLSGGVDERAVLGV